MAREFMLSTSDNKFDPFTQFDEWLEFDMRKGYNCCGLLDRFLQLIGASDELSEEDNAEITEEAINRILKIPVKEAENEEIKYIKLEKAPDDVKNVTEAPGEGS